MRCHLLVPRGHWRNIFVLNVHSLTDKKSDESRDSFYEKLEQVADIFRNENSGRRF